MIYFWPFITFLYLACCFLLPGPGLSFVIFHLDLLPILPFHHAPTLGPRAVTPLTPLARRQARLLMLLVSLASSCLSTSPLFRLALSYPSSVIARISLLDLSAVSLPYSSPSSRRRFLPHRVHSFLSYSPLSHPDLASFTRFRFLSFSLHSLYTLTFLISPLLISYLHYDIFTTFLTFFVLSRFARFLSHLPHLHSVSFVSPLQLSSKPPLSNPPIPNALRRLCLVFRVFHLLFPTIAFCATRHRRTCTWARL